MRDLAKLKVFLQKNVPKIQAFDTPNWAGDKMATIYNEDGIQVLHCRDYDYIEIFGLTEKQFKSLVVGGLAGNRLKNFENLTECEKSASQNPKCELTKEDKAIAEKAAKLIARDYGEVLRRLENE